MDDAEYEGVMDTLTEEDAARLIPYTNYNDEYDDTYDDNEAGNLDAKLELSNKRMAFRG